MNETLMSPASSLPPEVLEFRRACAADLEDVLQTSPLSIPRLYVSPDIVPAAVVTVRLKQWPARNGGTVNPARPDTVSALDRALRDHGIGATVGAWGGSGLSIDLATPDDVAALTQYAASQLPADCATAYRLRRAMGAIGITSTAQATPHGEVRIGTLSPQDALLLYECLTGPRSGTAAHALDFDDAQDLSTLAGLLEPLVRKASCSQIMVVVRLGSHPEIVLGNNVEPLPDAANLAHAIENAQQRTLPA